MDYALARRMNGLTASEIRELLKVTQRPDVISFAGGLPAPELFPAAELADHAGRVLREEGSRALQYSTTEGHEPLRRWIANRMRSAWGAAIEPAHVLITTGSQQGIELSAKLFLDEGDVVLCEAPTYLAALASFRLFQPRLVEVPSDEHGMDLDALARQIARRRPKLIYVIPSAQNPSGRTWSLDRRREFVELVNRERLPVVEDEAYFEVRYEGPAMPSLKAFDRRDGIICLGTFSKTLCPGLRVGWLACTGRLYDKYVILKQASDLHTSAFNERLIASYLATCDFEARLARIRDTYRVRRDAMLEALEAEMPPGVRFTRPDGGLFIWLELPEEVDAQVLFDRCLARNVAFVPGAPFFAEGRRLNTARLNFSCMPPDRIREGVRRMALALRELLRDERPAIPLAPKVPA